MLKDRLSEYGEIVACKIIKDKKEQSKGYAFVEFEDMKDFLRAYSRADGLKLGDRRLGVDAEFGRTSERFRPLRLGGGLGKNRKTKKTRFKRLFYKVS